MCTILFALQQHPDWPLIIAANRDEFYERPTRKIHFWEENSDILAGKDLKDGGSWMGINIKNLSFAALTNYRDPTFIKERAPSRGGIISDFLSEKEGFFERLKEKSELYNPFNLIWGSAEKLFYYSNIRGKKEEIEKGIHGLSNHFLNSPWPKVERGKKLLSEAILKGAEEEDLFLILEDKSSYPDESLPDTGMGLEWERILSPLFISNDIYGTRSSSVLRIDKSGRLFFTEKSWNEKAELKEKTRFEIETGS